MEISTALIEALPPGMEASWIASPRQQGRRRPGRRVVHSRTVKPAPGALLSHYRLEAPIGAGGMGEVWRATDTALDRSVAIKILPEAFSEDPHRLARFEREAKLLASLNHPNIAVIHGCIGGAASNSSPWSW